MAWCTECGAVDQQNRFCVNCGSQIAHTRPPEQNGQYPVAGFAPQVTDPVMRTGPISQQNPGGYPPPYFRPPPPPPPPKSSKRGWLVAVCAFIAVVTLVTTGLLLLKPWSNSTDQADGTVRPSTAAPPASASPSAPGPSSVSGIGRPPPTTTVVVTVPAPAPDVITTVPAPTPALDPMGGPNAAIGCGTGYIVQVASELDTTTFQNRVATLRASGTLPAGTKWAETASSCSIFTTQQNVLVLYAGPYASPYDACPARLTSPADAFIKGTTPDTATQYVSCLCPASTSALPTVTTVGQQGVWVGELQRVLGSKLDYTIGSINADPATGDPGRWGIYTAETAAAVGRFQNDNGLPATSQVDAATWSALQRATC